MRRDWRLPGRTRSLEHPQPGEALLLKRRVPCSAPTRVASGGTGDHLPLDSGDALGMPASSPRGRAASSVPRPETPAEPGTDVPFVLATEEEMRAYAFYVAGTVGHMLTELFVLRLGRRACRWLGCRS